jgi:patatin-like phospholipase/acyl hydrolase
MTEQTKILTCDGGGIRGLLTTIILESLETEIKAINTDASISSCFDMFAGTSTGSIIACGLSNGMSPASIREFYIKTGAKIFPKMGGSFWVTSLVKRLQNLRLSSPLFDPAGLESVLTSETVFPPNLLLGDLPKETLCVSYDTYNRKAVVFKSKDSKCSQVPVWQVCRASSAAPAAYPGYLLSEPHFLKDHQSGGKAEGDLDRQIPQDGLPLIDGGILANNPVLCAIAEKINYYSKQNPAAQENPLQKILVASFGTGQSGRRITPDNVRNWGALAWSELPRGIPLFQVCADGSADSIDFIASSLLRDNYQRFQPVYSEITSVFQADDDNLDKITKTAEAYLRDPHNRQRLQNLAQLVTTKG